MPTNDYAVDAVASAAVLTVRSRKHGVHRALVDADMVPVLRLHRWFVNVSSRPGTVYFQTKVGQPDGRFKQVSLHRFVLGDPAGFVVNHRDPNDALDNRRSNLRVATPAQSNRNRRKLASAFSAYKGVALDRATGKLVVKIRTPDGHKHLGSFPITPEGEIEAARAYDRAALQHHGDFAHTNFPRSDYGQNSAT